MSPQVDNRIGDELTRAVERGLASSHGFDEFCAAIGAEEVLLLLSDIAYFSTTARVDWLEFGGYDVRGRRGERRWRFRCEEARDERFLKASSCGIWHNPWEVDMPKGAHVARDGKDSASLILRVN